MQFSHQYISFIAWIKIEILSVNEISLGLCFIGSKIFGPLGGFAILKGICEDKSTTESYYHLALEMTKYLLISWLPFMMLVDWWKHFKIMNSQKK